MMVCRESEKSPTYPTYPHLFEGVGGGMVGILLKPFCAKGGNPHCSNCFMLHEVQLGQPAAYRAGLPLEDCGDLVRSLVRPEQVG